MNDSRTTEIERYVRAYESPRYGMGRRRQMSVQTILSTLTRVRPRGSLLDVGTGRGETLGFARELGYESVAGTEVVPELIVDDIVYAEAHALPFGDGEFDHVTCFDVLEHLVPDDVEPALRELHRVARRTVTVSASCRAAPWPGLGDLHISARPEPEWLGLVRQCWGNDAKCIGRAGGSPAFQVQK